MLELDLAQLARKGRLRVDADVTPDSTLWQGTGVSPHGALRVRLEAQKAAADVVVRGRIAGEFEVECRRCLAAVVVTIDEPVSFVFRPGISAAEAELAELYPLPDRARELDVGPPVREHVLLAVPAFAICRETCRGLCPRCGADLNQGPCGCAVQESDERWAALRKLKLD